MESVIVYVVIVAIVLLAGILKKQKKNIMMPSDKGMAESSAIPHKHKKDGVYETYSRKTHNAKSGAMPHKHEKEHYTSMCDASNLPPGYILLNGEKVRVADLEGK